MECSIHVPCNHICWMLNILLHQMANEDLLKYRFETTWDVNDMCKKYIGPAKACTGVDPPYCIIIYVVLVFIFLVIQMCIYQTNVRFLSEQSPKLCTISSTRLYIYHKHCASTKLCLVIKKPMPISFSIERGIVQSDIIFFASLVSWTHAAYHTGKRSRQLFYNTFALQALFRSNHINDCWNKSIT